MFIQLKIKFFIFYHYSIFFWVKDTPPFLIYNDCVSLWIWHRDKLCSSYILVTYTNPAGSRFWLNNQFLVT